jgi:hypothetical protein
VNRWKMALSVQVKYAIKSQDLISKGAITMLRAREKTASHF